jgi:hypothetical protein
LNEAGDSFKVRKIDSRVAAYLFNRATPYSNLPIAIGALLPDPDYKRIVLTVQFIASKKEGSRGISGIDNSTAKSGEPKRKLA